MNTRILLISDIHANYEALRKIEHLANECDIVICAGDFIGYYCQVNEVCDVVRRWASICVRGNHDDYLLNGCPKSVPEAVRFGIEYADRELDQDHRKWLASLPLLWGGRIGEISVLLVHGSPFSPLEEYLYENRIAGAHLEVFDFDLLVFGHTHRPLILKDVRPALVNPGSVGQSRDAPGDVCGAIVESESLRISPFRYPYDVSGVIQRARESGAGAWITKHLTPNRM